MALASDELNYVAADDSPEDTAGRAYLEVPVPLLPRCLCLPGAHYQQKQGFRKSVSACLNYIQEALFQNQWQRAAELMLNYFQALEDSTTKEMQAAPEIVWRLGTEILFHHPESSIEVVNSFVNSVKNIGVKNYLQMCLEQAFYLLCQGLTEDAHSILTVAESWRYGVRVDSQEKLMKLIQAYRALLDHHAWLKKRDAMLAEGQEDESTSSQGLHSYFRQASLALREIIQFPGVWDPFVQSYVDVLHGLVPSHQLMLEFTELLQRSGKEKHHRMALQVIFDVLDFSEWKESTKAWTCLAKKMKKALKCGHRDWVQAEWNSRKGWWPAFHFSSFLAREDWRCSKHLACKKALVAGIVMWKGSKYFTSILHQGSKVQKENLKTMKRFVKKHSLAKPQ
ncbi:TATA box-binding protein-associated factor RNA polymerase I subunit A isoform X2 [Rhinatrema bivittatum]|uniref:TATA box-binding protein-associated factor RNA polymerase I subunit A isoform X2 n=1 Tax=Rhinatrema bivittatum TaxID=194408 RepID=UPI00112930DD|nr:TATA box-binding protein-associated factor RNA polymerase I subunit A isoform X2 [Rhinatrema bivittatum]